MADNTYTYQTFRGNFYVVTTGSSAETTITDTISGMVLTTIPAQTQGIVFAVGKGITATNPIKINIVK